MFAALKKLLLVLLSLLILLVIFFFYSTKDFQKAEPRLYHNARILTINEAMPTASAMAVRDGRITAIGGEDVLSIHDLKSYKQVDLQGQVVMPGFIDPHTHAVLSVMMENMVDLSGFTHKTNAAVWSHLQQVVAKTSKGKWIVCKGIDPVLVSDLVLPTKQFLDDIAPDHPVLVISQSIHSYWANSEAFKLAGIDNTTPNPTQESYYEKNDNGELTGLIVEQAAVLPILGLLENVLLNPEVFVETANKVMQKYAAKGNTSIVSTGLSVTDDKPIQLFNYLSKHKITTKEKIANFLNIFPDRSPLPRHFIYMRHDRAHLLPDSRKQPNDFFDILGIKHWFDGSPYIGSMYLNDPYEHNTFTEEKLDIPEGHTGKHLLTAQDLESFVKSYHTKGWQIAIHTQGDAAISDVLGVYEGLSDELDFVEARHRLEHCLLMPTENLKQMAQLGMTPSYHINHLYFYGDALQDHIIGVDRAKTMLPLKETLDHGLRLSLHADQPMFESDPFRLIQTAVERETTAGTKINTSQTISIEQALKALTIDAAWQIHKEDQIGSLEVGKYADFIILDKHPYEVAIQDLETIRCLETYIAGNKVTL